MKKILSLALLISILLLTARVWAATIVPLVIQQPGTQPQEISNLETPDKCDNCHGNYNIAVEPGFNWRGSMMSEAGRDPIFWATMAVADQNFDGSGDLCIRCHSTAGWMSGRSTPTDGSGLNDNIDADGVECDFCHRATNPDNSEHLGVMLPPFVANEPNPADPDGIEGYYGSGMASLWNGSDKLGPYADATARHKFMQSKFHRSVDFCGTCHDVSNPAVGNLAHNNGAQGTAGPVVADGVLDGTVDSKAAFNNPPYKYGIVERTFSEYKSSLLPRTRVKDYLTLPADLQGGALQAGYQSALLAGTGGDYQDGDPRYFSCQTCHLRPIIGQGCNKNPPLRQDLPLHDMTGGNYWMPDAIVYLDTLGKLRIGGGLTTTKKAALAAGQTRAMKQLREAATLAVDAAKDTVKVVNHTGHKLISGYPEGRRMWLHIQWYDKDMTLLREDGAYGPLVKDGKPVTAINPATGEPVQVASIQNLYDPNTRIYEAHYGMTREWANQLLSLGYAPSLALSYDRYSGATEFTLGDLASGNVPHLTYHETFHFVLNNDVFKDNRIPPYGMDYTEAARRNALPVPAAQYGSPGPGGTYNYWDEVALNVPPNAVYASIDLLYQPTSWEYIQFLDLANNGQNPFLAAEGKNMLEAWLNTGMAAPYVMASAIWGQKPPEPTMDLVVDSLTTWSVDKQGNLIAETNTFTPGRTVGIVARTVDEGGTPLSGSQVFMDIVDAGGNVVSSLQGFSAVNGEAVLQWKTPRRQAPGSYLARVTSVLNNGYQFNPATSVTEVPFTLQ